MRNLLSAAMLALALSVGACNPGKPAPAMTGPAAAVARDYYIVIKLIGMPGRQRTIRMKLRILFETGADDRRTQDLAAVQDSLRANCHGVKPEDLDDPEKMRRLKAALLVQARAAAPDLNIRDIVFENVIVL